MRSHWRFYPWANGCCPWGINFLCVIHLPKVKLPRRSSHGYIKKKKRITHESFRGKFYGLIKSQSSSTNYEKVKCTKQQKSQVVYLRCSSWRQIVRETELKLPNFSRILSTAVNFFQGFTLIKFKSTLKHTQIFFKSAFKNYFLRKSLKPF